MDTNYRSSNKSYYRSSNKPYKPYKKSFIKEKPGEFKVNLFEFPILSSNNMLNESQSNSTFDSYNNIINGYIDKIKIEKDEVLEKPKFDGLQEGMIRFVLEKNNKITKEMSECNDLTYNKVTYENSILDEKEVTMSDVVRSMEYRWDNYANNYIELYGEDEYTRMYTMPNYKFETIDDEYDDNDGINQDFNDYDYLDDNNVYNDYY